MIRRILFVAIVTFVYRICAAIPFGQEQRIFLHPTAYNLWFGSTLASEGDLLVIGAPGSGRSAYTGLNFLKVYSRIGNAWFIQATIMTSRGNGSAISVNEGRIVAAEGDFTGRVCMYEQVGGQWTRTKTIGSNINATSAILDGNVLYLGCPSSSGGKVRVYTFNGSAWDLTQTISYPGTNTDAKFGQRIVVKDDRMFVSAVNATFGSPARAGAVYTYSLNGGLWEPTGRINALVPMTGSLFGEAISLENDLLLIGSPFFGGAGGGADQLKSGASYVFRRTGETWNQESIVRSPEIQTDAYFGYGGIINNGKLIIGCPGYDGLQGTNQGGAHVFENVGGSWMASQFIGCHLEPLVETFGYLALKTAPNEIVFSAPDDSSVDMPRHGAAMVYRDTGDGFKLAQPLFVEAQTARSNAFEFFGEGIYCQNETLVVSNPESATSSDSIGDATVFRRQDGRWTPDRRLVAPGLSPDGFGLGDLFGRFFAANYAGNIYVFDLDAKKKEHSWEISTGTAEHFGRPFFVGGRLVAIATSQNPHTARIVVFDFIENQWMEAYSTQVTVSESGYATIHAVSSHSVLLRVDIGGGRIRFDVFDIAPTSATMSGTWPSDNLTAAMQDDLIVLGHWSSSLPRAEIFERGESGWQLTQTILPSVNRGFGSSLSLLGPYLAIGHYRYTDSTTAGGAVFVYERGPSGYREARRIVYDPDNTATEWMFGIRLLLTADELLVTSPYEYTFVTNVVGGNPIRISTGGVVHSFSSSVTCTITSIELEGSSIGVGSPIDAARTDDAYYSILSDEGRAAAIFTVHVEGPIGTLKDAFCELGHTRPALVETLELYNRVTGAWEQISGGFAITRDHMIRGVSSTPFLNYVLPGKKIKLRVSSFPANDEDPVNDGWITQIDQVGADVQ